MLSDADVARTVSEHAQKIAEALSEGELHDGVMQQMFTDVGNFVIEDLEASYDDLSPYLDLMEEMLDGSFDLLRAGAASQATALAENEPELAAEVGEDVIRKAFTLPGVIVQGYLNDTIPLFNWYIAQVFENSDILESMREVVAEELPEEVQELLNKILEAEQEEV